MEPRQLQAKLTMLRGGLVIALAVLLGRLWSLQIARWSDWDKRAQGNRTQIVWPAAPRGLILDRRGEVLAGNRVIYQVQVTPQELPSDPKELNAVVLRLASVLQASTVQVESALEKAGEVATPDAVLEDLGEEISQLQAIRLDELGGELPGVRVIEATQRYYPGKALAAHALGYARAITAGQYEEVRALVYPDLPGGPETPPRGKLDPQPYYAADSIYGQTGVERMMELVRVGREVVPALQGRRGADEFEVDARGQPRLMTRVPPIRGASVYLTLDARLQRVAEQALAHPFVGSSASPSDGAAVAVVDVNTGEILVLASYPAVDPNRYVRGFRPGEYPKLIGQNPGRPEVNRAIAGLYPPASTFKMISGCAILERTKATVGTSFRCTGRIHVGARHDAFTCWKPGGHGEVDFERGVAESCDVYFWRMVLDAGLTGDDIAAYARGFGLGEETGCGLPGEEEGLVPTPDWKRRVHDDRWRQGDTLNMVIGQGFNKATPLQMALVTAAVANRGTLPRAQIIRKVVWAPEAGRPALTWGRAEGRRVGVTPSHLQAVRAGMRVGVVSTHGTGHWAMQGMPVSVASKTGSAEAIPGRLPHSWFVCFAPYERPRYAVAVIVEFAGHGAAVAGHVARQILQAAFTPSGRTAGRPSKEGTAVEG